MKKVIAVFVIVLVAVSAWAQEKETRSVGSFDKIVIGGAYNVYITQGDVEEVRLEGSKEAIEKIETESENGTLKIKQKKSKGWNWDNSGKLKVYVTFKSLTAIVSSGSSNVEVTSKVKADEFSLVTSGSSDVKMSMDVNSVKIVLSGSSDVELSGMAKEQSIVVSGSGDIEALDLESNNVSVKISGSGSVSVHANESLNGVVSGSGDIRYRGTPKQSIKISGSGSIEQVK